MTSDEAQPGQGDVMRFRLRAVLVMALLSFLVACGDSPLESIGLRSSEWISEPTVPTTIAVVTTTPRVVAVDLLLWANDEIETSNLGDHSALLQEVFERREGDRFIQASRHEIAVALPGMSFPGVAPSGAEWVSSQLIFDNDGSIASDPSAAFGIWSAEPYTRSRSVAQMVVMRVATDPVAATEVASQGVDVSCDRFADNTSDRCEVISVGDRATWLFTAAGGSTIVWFDGEYRYELFGRSFVPASILEEMSAGMIPLTSLVADAS